MELPPLTDVFFTHYQCDKFEEGNTVHNLCIIYNDEITVFIDDEESKMIKDFSEKVNELQAKGLKPVHWGQNTHYYGPDALNKRYHILTGKSLFFKYNEGINLAYELKLKFGENYSYLPATNSPHSRLDNLAVLNQFKGGSDEKESITFPSKRAELLPKIYFNVLKNTLKTYTGNIEATEEPEKKRMSAPDILAVLEQLGVFTEFKRRGYNRSDVMDVLFQITGKNRQNLGVYYDEIRRANDTIKIKDKNLENARKFLNSKGL